MDRYARTMLTITAACAVVVALRSLATPLPVAHAGSKEAPAAAAPPAAAPAANAGHGGRTCHYTFIDDAGAPSISPDGDTAMKGKNWQRVSAEGWHMTGIVAGSSNTFRYFFERCE